MTTIADAFGHYFALADGGASLAYRVAASGLDDDEAIDAASSETLTAWTMAAMAPSVPAARAANDLGSLKAETGRFRQFLEGVFDSMRGSASASSFSTIAQSDLVVFRDEESAPAAVLWTATHDDADPRKIAPYRLCFASIGAVGKGLKMTATLPGHALGAVALEATGAPRTFVEKQLGQMRELRALRRAEGHRLAKSEGLVFG